MPRAARERNGSHLDPIPCLNLASRTALCFLCRLSMPVGVGPQAYRGIANDLLRSDEKLARCMLHVVFQ